jgi:hypothetical protein
MPEGIGRASAAPPAFGNGAIEVGELYRALRSIVAGATQGNQPAWLARQDRIGDFTIF